MKPPPIVYYITAHGYGHGARSADIIRALVRAAPEVPIILATDLPAGFFDARISEGAVWFRPGSFDVGMIQIDSIRVDLDATLDRVWALHEERESRIRAEVEFLKQSGACMIVADIPAMPLEAAARAGIGRIGVGNFSWDWIYSEFLDRDSRWATVVETYAEQYRRADLLLRLPFAGPMDAFRVQKGIGLVADAGRPRRDRIAARTGADPGRTWVLLSFTALEWTPEVVRRVAALLDYQFFTVAPLSWPDSGIRTISRTVVPFSDVVASCDIVVSKPGFGIVSECIVNEKPLVYADRSDFREYPILVEGIRGFLAHAHLPADRLYRGDLKAALEEVMGSAAPRQRCPTGGAESAAAELLARWGRT